MRANVGILAGMLLNLMLLQLKLSTETLIALGALHRQNVDVMSLEVPSHIALNCENLIAVGMRAGYHGMLLIRLVGTFFMSLEVELVCVLLRASFDIALEVFLKIAKTLCELVIQLGCEYKYLSGVTEQMSIQTVLSFKALLAEFAFESEFRSIVFR